MKITGGALKGQSLIISKKSLVRPTSVKLRQTVFNICSHRVEGARFLDVFAGSGAMGIEALSRGARWATFIENHPPALKALRANLDRLGLTDVATLCAGDALTYLRRLRRLRQVHAGDFEVIYIDPPYSSLLAMKALHLVDTLHLLRPEGVLFLEVGDSSPLPLPPLSHLMGKSQRKVGGTLLYEFTTFAHGEG